MGVDVNRMLASASINSSPGPNTSRVGLAAVAGVLVAFFAIRNDTFLTTSNATAIAVNMSSVTIAAVGTSALLIMGHVDLSIGSMYGLSGMIVAEVASRVDNPELVLVSGLVAGLVLGSINGLLVLTLKISPLIVTIGLLAIYAGLAYVVSANSVFGFSEEFVSLGRGEIASIPIPVVVAAAILLVGGFVLTRTVVGLRMYAIGGDTRAAERAGIRVRRLVFGAYAGNGILIGLIAVLTTAQLSIGAPNLGAGFEFDVLTAVILGGVAFAGGAGRPLGVLVGVITIGILNSGLIFEGLESWWQQVAKGTILIGALGADQYAAARRTRRAARAGLAGTLPDDEGLRPVDQALRGEFDSAAKLRRGDQIARPVLEVKGVSKSYGAVRALNETSLTVSAGEVVALLGDNGAGKSTLVKIVAGAVQPDRGTMRLGGDPVSFQNPAGAREAGIETVYQDLALCPNLSVVHNLMLGNEPTRRWLGIVPVRDDKSANAEAVAKLSALSIRLRSTSVLVESLSGGQRQAIAIARALEDHVRVVCLDEPTAALGVAQTANVLRLVKTAASSGTAIIMITHDVASVIEVADRVVVMRSGRLVYDGRTSDLNQIDLLQLMAGLELDSLSSQSASSSAPS